MEQQQLEEFRVWFDNYVGGFYGGDDYVNANLKLKEEHSRRTCKEVLYLAEELGLGANQRRIAEVTALFHDVGRFEQFVRYRTYNDVRSVNHCLLGLEVLHKTRVLEAVDEKERELIERAIEYHGLKELPKDLEPERLLLSKLVRDADKLDVLYVVTQYYKQYRDSPEKFMLELEFPDEPEYSPELVERVLRGRQIDYGELRTLNDMRILQLGWVYDVNFTATLKRIRERKFFEVLFDFLPETHDIKRLRENILGFVDSRIKREIADR